MTHLAVRSSCTHYCRFVLHTASLVVETRGQSPAVSSLFCGGSNLSLDTYGAVAPLPPFSCAAPLTLREVGGLSKFSAFFTHPFWCAAEPGKSFVLLLCDHLQIILPQGCLVLSRMLPQHQSGGDYKGVATIK